MAEDALVLFVEKKLARYLNDPAMTTERKLAEAIVADIVDFAEVGQSSPVQAGPVVVAPAGLPAEAPRQTSLLVAASDEDVAAFGKPAETEPIPIFAKRPEKPAGLIVSPSEANDEFRPPRVVSEASRAAAAAKASSREDDRPSTEPKRKAYWTMGQLTASMEDKFPSEFHFQLTNGKNYMLVRNIVTEQGEGAEFAKLIYMVPGSVEGEASIGESVSIFDETYSPAAIMQRVEAAAVRIFNRPSSMIAPEPQGLNPGSQSFAIGNVGQSGPDPTAAELELAGSVNKFHALVHPVSQATMPTAIKNS